MREVFEHAERPLSIAEELLEGASSRVDGLGVATVYRAVSALLDEGWIQAVEIPGEAPRYERSGKEHHHHFQCEKCDRVFDIAGCIDNLRKLDAAEVPHQGSDGDACGLCASCSSS